MIYVLWSIPSASALATYDSEVEALAAVRAGIERNGRAYGLDLLLTRETRRGDTRTIATGAQLIERALHGAPAYGTPKPRRTASA